jgi:hypothetical protein
MISIKTSIRLLGATIAISALLGASMNAHAKTANYKNTRAYKDAFACGKESLQSDPSGNSAVPYCIGNSHDPSKVEMQAFKDATAAQNGGTKPSFKAQGSGKPKFDQNCYDTKLKDFRSGIGKEAPVSNDMINEWRGECGLPPL